MKEDKKEIISVLNAFIIDMEDLVKELLTFNESKDTFLDWMCGCSGASDDEPYPPICSYHAAKMIIESSKNKSKKKDPRRSILDI